MKLIRMLRGHAAIRTCGKCGSRYHYTTHGLCRLCHPEISKALGGGK